MKYLYISFGLVSLQKTEKTEKTDKTQGFVKAPPEETEKHYAFQISVIYPFGFASFQKT